jgi:nitrate reductase assembly molybdenum cofactor insertion protein NarJ
MISEAVLSKRTTEELLQDAAQWRLIGLLLECPRDDWFAQVAALAAEVGDEQLRQAAALARQEASEGLYHTTFGPGGPAAPREVSYHDSLLAGQTLAQLRAQYEAFRYAPALDEAPDHIAVEAGFMAYLRLKEAYAVHAGAQGEAEITAEAARNFLQNQLSAMAGPLAESLACSGIGYLELLAAALRERT